MNRHSTTTLIGFFLALGNEIAIIAIRENLLLHGFGDSSKFVLNNL
jgi:hypothetical protein